MRKNKKGKTDKKKVLIAPKGNIRLDERVAATQGSEWGGIPKRMEGT